MGLQNFGSKCDRKQHYIIGNEFYSNVLFKGFIVISVLSLLTENYDFSLSAFILTDFGVIIAQSHR